VKPYADHFSRLATSYVSCRPGYPPALFAYLAERVQRRELAWDCAAGSGQATVPLAAWFRRVVATDISASMLDQAPRRSNIEYRVTPAQSSGLGDSSTDLVAVAQALHWLELDPFYEEASRVLIPGGLLAVWTYGSQALDDRAMDDVLSRFYQDVVGPYWPVERRHVESGYRTLAFPFVELKTPQFTMEERWSLAQLLGYIRTWSAAQRYLETVGTNPVDQLARELTPLWGEPAAQRRIRWPLTLRIGRRPA
jgi:ubiquinone/menaquinone biosynthesis C-methylase UbiE